MMLHITASKIQINYIIRYRDRAEDFGDMATWMKCQGLFLYFQVKMSIGDIANALKKTYESVRRWIIDFAVYGASCVKPKIRSGRQPKLSKSQRKELYSLLQQKPCDVGLQGGCWTSAMIQILIKEHFGVTYSPKYLPELLKSLGFSFQRAKFESSHLDPVKRQIWIGQTWPEIKELAHKKGAHIFFEDESSFAQWGSLFYTWAPRGCQPVVKTIGIRKSLKVFGVIEVASGRLIYQAIEGKLNAHSYIIFLRKILHATRKHVIIIHDGASYHTAKETKKFVNSIQRFTLFRLPAYSPDYNPIEGLWKKIKKSATHLMYFPSFENLVDAVNGALTFFEKTPDEILKLFGLYRKLKTL